jgi:hypothetical protein
MTNGFASRRAEIMAFLGGLSTREKLIVLTYLANDVGIGERISDLARAVLDVHRAHHRVDALKFTRDSCNLDLEFLARKKGCRLEAVQGPGDRWRIIPLLDRGGIIDIALSRIERDSFTRKQALDLLRSLPDRQ